MGRHRARELRKHRKEQHRHRRRQTEQAVAHHTQKIQGDGGQPSRSNRTPVHRTAGFGGDFFLGRIHVVVLGRLKASLSRQARVFLADIVQNT